MMDVTPNNRHITDVWSRVSVLPGRTEENAASVDENMFSGTRDVSTSIQAFLLENRAIV